MGLTLSFDSFALGGIKLGVVALSKLLLEVEDLVLESEFVNFVLCLKCKNLIVGILAEAGAVICLLIKFLNLINSLIDLTTVAFVHTGLVSELLAPDVNVFSQQLVLRLKSVELDSGVLASIFEKVDFMLVFSHLRGGWTNGLQVTFLFFELFAQLFFLVGKYHKVFLFVLVFLGERVNFTLETLSFGFVDDALHSTAFRVSLIHIC